MTGKAWVATLLLPVGVALVEATAETHNPWWAVLGNLCLLFVPALIIDAARDRWRR